MAASMPEVPPVKRIVLMVDLHPLLLQTLEGSKFYLSSVLLSASTLLSHEQLSSSLFGFRLFFSSLSPILSTSRVHRFLGEDPAAQINFDLPGPTLESISRTIDSLQISVSDPPRSNDGECLRKQMPQAASMAQFLVELGDGCHWEEATERPDPKENCSRVVNATPNLVVLFSSLPRSLKTAAEFVDVDVSEHSPLKSEQFRDRFARIFGSVSGLFDRKGVHLTWIDITGCNSCPEPHNRMELVRKAITSIGWGFCPAEAIVLGSALIPFGLIYPYIASRSVLESVVNLKKCRAELTLQIADVSGKPLECNCCDLELIDLGLSKEGPNVWKLFSDPSNGGVAKITVKEVWKNDEVDKLIPKVWGSVMLGPFSEESEEENVGVTRDEVNFSDGVLQLICRGRHQVFIKKPVWQLVLTFLYRRSLCASVSISSNADKSFIGVIQPFSVDLAVLWILKNSDYSILGNGINGASTSQPLLVDPASEISSSQDSGGKSKASKKKNKALANLSWRSFCKLVYCSKRLDLGTDLEDVYFLKEDRISKKLRFLQCWIRQMKKANTFRRITLDQQSGNPDAGEETKDPSVIVSSQQESQLPVSSSPLSPAQNTSNAPYSDVGVDDLESLIESIPQKIQHALDSKEVDLGDLAERLVELASRALYANLQKSSGDELPPGSSEDDFASKVAAELSSLLLIRPKELALKYKSCTIQNKSSSSQSADQKVREHEIQILFRMEILRSSINESTKTKLIKDICSLLENIEFNLQGGMFSGESLIGFAERAIKSRYAHSLDGVIHSIYAKMEFFSFDGDDEEDSLSVPNSSHNDETAENNENLSDTTVDPVKGSTTTKGLPCKSSFLKSGKPGKHKLRDEGCSDKLANAQETRERARRFSHFTSRLQNLQRVWAPKQKSDTKSNYSSAKSIKKRRNCRVSRNDMVLETPITGKKRPYSEEGKIGGARDMQGDTLKRCLPKALFIDDDE